jgi:hypothetical protein
MIGSEESVVEDIYQGLSWLLVNMSIYARSCMEWIELVETGWK